jgi:PPOX class probable F420-dependent enzyme
MQLPQSARHLIENGAHAHLVTLNEDGSPQVTLVWAGLEGDDIVTAHLFETHKVSNLRSDGRVTLSFESPSRSDMGLLEYLVVYGRATIEQGGAPQLLQRLARVYLGPDAIFPTMPDPPPGFVNRVTVDRISGVGPWTGRAV